MTVTKCDICKKEIRDDKPSIFLHLKNPPGFYATRNLCAKCSTPVTAFLKKHNLERDERADRRAA